MRAVIQRVREARVEVDDQVVGQIGAGVVALVGAGARDTERDAEYIAKKIGDLRIFNDPEGLMNLSVEDMGGQVLAVSQFTLYGDCRKGRRPSFLGALEPARAKELFEKVCHLLEARGLKVATGVFRAQMQVHLVNDGPVTLMLDSEKSF
jgi:D-tyrosyl-tRNA(Tyr) deacylase